MRILLLAALLASCAEDEAVDDTGCGAPVCDGGDATRQGAEVCLTGTATCVRDDPTFLWSFDRTPAASVLDDQAFGEANGTSGACTVCFVPDALGSYVVTLVVSDGTGTSDPCTVVITVTEVDPSPRWPASDRTPTRLRTP